MAKVALDEILFAFGDWDLPPNPISTHPAASTNSRYVSFTRFMAFNTRLTLIYFQTSIKTLIKNQEKEFHTKSTLKLRKNPWFNTIPLFFGIILLFFKRILLTGPRPVPLNLPRRNSNNDNFIFRKL